MSALSVWILTIVGVIIIGVIVDIILPEGSINKYIRGLIAIFTVFAIVSPLPSINLDKINFGEFFDSDSTQVDDAFVDKLNRQKISGYEDLIVNTLKQHGYHGVEVTIFADCVDNNINISQVFVDLTNLVLNDKNLNINKYDQIKVVITSIVKVKEDDILFYGGSD